MGVGITKWNIIFSSIYEIGTDKVSYLCIRKKLCTRDKSLLYTIFTMKLPQSDHSVNPLSTPLPMKDEGAVGSGQIRFINENVLSYPGLHGFYKKWKRQNQKGSDTDVNRPADWTCPSHR